MVSMFPNLLPSSADWRLLSNTATFTSPFDGSVQTFERPGARWVASLHFSNLPVMQARTLIAFLTSMRGASGRFTMYDHTLPVPRGAATGTPTFTSMAGPTILTGGWSASVIGVLLAGDMVAIGSQLFMVVADSNSDALGNATLILDPPPRKILVGGTPVVTDRPTATFRLSDDNQSAWHTTTVVHNIAFKCEEVFV